VTFLPGFFRAVRAVALLVGIGGVAMALVAHDADAQKPAKARTKPAARGRGSPDGGPASSPPPPAASKSAGDGGPGELVNQKTVDGGIKVFRFGEMEIEGRLKNPQLVFFLRRVRAEFAAGDLGHRSFLRELSDTRHDPNF
jgi:hypothetical protein